MRQCEALIYLVDRLKRRKPLIPAQSSRTTEMTGWHETAQLIWFSFVSLLHVTASRPGDKPLSVRDQLSTAIKEGNSFDPIGTPSGSVHGEAKL